MPESMNNLIGGMLTGFTGAKNQARDRQLNEEFKKIVMEQHKLQGKKLESDMRLSEIKQNLMGQYLGSGIGGAKTPVTGQTGATPTQSGLPQMIAQGQAQGSGLYSQKAKENALYRMMFGGDMPTDKIEYRVLSNGNLAVLQGGKMIDTITGPTKYHPISGVGPDGAPFTGFAPVPGTGPQDQSASFMPPAGPIPQIGGGPGNAPQAPMKPPNIAGYVPTGPGPLNTFEKPSDTQKANLDTIDETLAAIQELRKYTKDKSLYGYWPTFQHSLYQDPGSLTKAVGRNISEKIAGKPNPKLFSFQASVEKFNSKIRKQLYAGNLTEGEATRYMRQAAEASGPDQLNAVLDVLEKENLEKRKILNQSTMMTPAQRSQQLPGVQLKVPGLPSGSGNKPTTYEEWKQRFNK